MNSLIFSKQLLKKTFTQVDDLISLKRDATRAIPKFFICSESHEHIKLCPMHFEWHELLDNNRFCLLIAPRGHGKSVQIVQGRVAVEIGNNPNLRVKILSGTEDLAKKRVKSIKDMIENSDDYKKLYGNLKPAKAGNWGDLSFTVKRNIPGIKESTLEAFGIMGTATGDRADLIVLDDIVTFENSIGKPSQRPMIKKKFWGDIMKWLVPKTGRLWYIATIWHQDDLTSELKSKSGKDKRFQMKFYAIDANHTPLWEERFDKQMLIDEEKDDKPSYDRAYRNMPVSSEDSTFDWDSISTSIRKDNPSVLIGMNTKIYIGVDLAISRKTTADYTTLMIGGIDTETRKKFPIEMIRGRFTSPMTARAVLNATKKYNPSMVYVENNQYQASLIEWIEEMEELPEWKEMGWFAPNIMGYRTGNQKHDMFEGLPSMALEFVNGIWTICIEEHDENPLEEGGHICSDNNCLCHLADELAHYPFGKKDDCVMSLWLLDKAMTKDLSFFIVHG